MEFTLDIPWPWRDTGLVLVQQLASAALRQASAMGIRPVGMAILAGAGLLAIALVVRCVVLFGKAVVQREIERLVGLSLLAGSVLLGAFIPLVYAIPISVIAATLWGYAKQRPFRRVIVVLTLRLLAVALTFLTVVRPAVGFRSELRIPSVLLIALDFSSSMTIRDEFNNQTREEALKATMDRCKPILEELRDEREMTVVLTRFHSDSADYDPSAPANGTRSDYGSMLNGLFERFGHEPNLRGLLIVGDGADNGLRFPAAQEASRWRAAQCPINGFIVGKDTTTSQQKDLAIVSVNVEPTPVYVKGRMVLRAVVNAYGCENAPIQPRLYFDNTEVVIEKKYVNKQEVTEGRPAFPLTERNEFVIETTAPPTPGEIRVTLRLSALPGEVTLANNEISTYVSVVKEGVSVLLVDDVREESKYLKAALAADPRFRLFHAVRQTEAAPPPGQADLFQLDRQAYDVIILGNISARRLSAGNPKILEKIRELVSEKGMGLLMMGGRDAFGGTPGEPGSGDWRGTTMEELLPVELTVRGELKGPLELHPTAAGKTHYLLQIGASDKESADLWTRLNGEVKLAGANRLSKEKAAAPGKPGAEVLARTEANGQGEPLLVAQGFGRGRTLAFAADTTFQWTRFGLPDSLEGVDIHNRFWKQVVLWLAQQENSEGSVWVKPDFRRVGAGAKQAFSVGVKGKTGRDLPGGKYEAKISGPDGASHVVPISREGNLDRGTFWKTAAPGEYRVEVSGLAKDVDGKSVTGRASVRFLVYQDDAELFQQAAQPGFLGDVAYAGGGRKQVYRLDDLPQFLKELKDARRPEEQAKVTYWPDWRSRKLTPFLPVLMVIFLVILGLEWGIRRWWGMA